MTSNIQTIVVLFAVAAAVAFLARRAYATLARKKTNGCGSFCGGCGGSHGGKQLVSIDSLTVRHADWRSATLPKPGSPPAMRVEIQRKH